MDDHRSTAFADVVLPLLQDLKALFRTADAQPFVFAATGTGGWEAALVNTCSPGERLLAVRNGQFSNGFAESAGRHGLVVDAIDVAWGEGVPALQVGEALAADGARRIKGVLMVYNETSTGVCSDVAAVRRAMDATGHPALLYVDAVSAMGSLPFEMDRWGVDLAVTASQKGLGLPPGLAIVCASQKALAHAETARCARSFFDFAGMARSNRDGYFPYTPAIGLLFGLREALAILFEEGLDAVYERHRRLASGVRAAVAAWGLDVSARRPEWFSDSVTAVVVPDGVNSDEVVDTAFGRYNLSLGRGLGRLAGRAFRIGHMGDVNELMVLGALCGVEMAMADVGIDVTVGAGVAAAACHFRGTHSKFEGRPGGGVR
ncbi:MAG TPA: aminotransferase class V-fold PLP-dependent enzyme [Actinomycetota bacterium]|nr:aminotransferase class V-fold PLP-dependent enzyme [Actinomycetota bacterium]